MFTVNPLAWMQCSWSHTLMCEVEKISYYSFTSHRSYKWTLKLRQLYIPLGKKAQRERILIQTNIWQLKSHIHIASNRAFFPSTFWLASYWKHEHRHFCNDVAFCPGDCLQRHPLGLHFFHTELAMCGQPQNLTRKQQASNMSSSVSKPNFNTLQKLVPITPEHYPPIFERTKW